MGFVRSPPGYDPPLPGYGLPSLLDPSSTLMQESFAERLDPLDPSSWQILGASFRQYNAPYRLARSMASSDPAIMESVEPIGGFDWYDPFMDMQGPADNPEKYSRNPAYTSYLSDAASPDHMAILKSNLDQDIMDQETIRTAGTGQTIFGIGAAFVLDPITWIAPLKLISTGSLAKNIMLNARRGALYGFGQTAVQESILQGTSAVARPEEAAVALGLAPVVGGVFGGALGVLAKGSSALASARYLASTVTKKDTDELVERYLAQQAESSGRFYDPTFAPPIPGYPGMSGQYVGGSQVRFAPGIGDDPIFDPFARNGGTSVGIDPNKYPFGNNPRKPPPGRPLNQPDFLGSPDNIGPISRAIAFISPGFRTRTSFLPSTIMAAEALVESGVITIKATLGIAPKVPVENKIKLWNATLAERTADLRKSWVSYRGRISGDEGAPTTALGMQISDVARKTARKEPSGLSKQEFNQEVSSVLRGGASDIQEINDISKLIRDDLDLIFDESVVSGLLSKEDFIENYLPRLWNVSLVKERNDELTRRILNWQLDNLPVERRLTLKQIKLRLEQIFRSPDGLERVVLDAEEAALVKASMKEAKTSATVARKGIFKQRTIEVDDSAISEFISQDIDEILRSYWRLSTADIEIVREFGDLRMSKALNAIRGDGNDLIAKVKDVMKIGEIKIEFMAFHAKNLAGKPAFYRDSKKTIFMDLLQIDRMWENKAWLRPKVKGVDPLDSALFPTKEKWQEFVLHHEYAHSVVKRRKIDRDSGVLGESLGEYENRINKIALNSFAKGEIAGKKYIDIIPSKILNIQKRVEADIRDLEGMRDILRGVYGIPEDPYSIPSRSARLALEFNNLVSLGGATISSIPDIARIPMVAGMATIPMLRLMVTDFATFKIAASEVLKAGTALDMELMTRAIALSGTGDLPARFSRPEKAMGYATNAFFIANLLSPWNSFIKRAAGTAIGHEILELSEKWASGTISKNRRTKLANAYISQKDAVAIANQFDKYGDTVKGLRIPNTSKWTDENAVKKFRSALVHDVDITIVTPGAGDQPLFAHKIWGRLITQYKSFLFAAATRVMVPGLQQKDSRTLFGLMMMVFVGGLVSNFKDRQNGRQPSKDVFDFLIDGFDQSGVASWFMSVNQAMEAISGNTFGLRPTASETIGKITGERYEPPYGSSTAWKIGQGSPVAGKVYKAGQVVRDVVTGDVDSGTRKDAWSAFVPLGNHPVTKMLRDMRLSNVLDVSSWMEETSKQDPDSTSSSAPKSYSKRSKDSLVLRLADSMVEKDGMSRSKATILAEKYSNQIVENRNNSKGNVPASGLTFPASTSESTMARDGYRLDSDSSSKLRIWRKSLLKDPGMRSRSYLEELISKIDAKLD